MSEGRWEVAWVRFSVQHTRSVQGPGQPGRQGRESGASFLKEPSVPRPLRHPLPLSIIRPTVRALRDHFLPHANVHSVWTTPSRTTGRQVPSPEMLLTSLPPPILPENSEYVSTRRRFPSQSYSSCALIDNIKWLTTVCVVLKSSNTHIFTISSLRRTVSGSAYTVIPSSVEPIATHSAYAGPLLNTRSVISNQKPRQ